MIDGSYTTNYRYNDDIYYISARSWACWQTDQQGAPCVTGVHKRHRRLFLVRVRLLSSPFYAQWLTVGRMASINEELYPNEHPT